MEREKSMQWIRPKIDTAGRSGLLFAGFKAWHARVDFGVESMRERLGPARTRAVRDDPANPGARVAVTVTEHASAADALEALALELEANQLAELPAGPATIGEVSFVHPSGVPPAVFLARANLTVWVMSFGNRNVDVTAIARRVDEDLQSRPAQARPDSIDVSVAGDTVRVNVPFAGEDVYLKAFAVSAELRKRDEGIVIVGGQGEIEVFALEPRRETLSAKVRAGKS